MAKPRPQPKSSSSRIPNTKSEKRVNIKIPRAEGVAQWQAWSIACARPWLGSPELKKKKMQTYDTKKEKRPKTTSGIKSSTFSLVFLLGNLTDNVQGSHSMPWRLLHSPHLAAPGHGGSRWQHWVRPQPPFLRKSTAREVYLLQLGYSSPSFSKESHSVSASSKHSVALSFPRNVTIFFLHWLPENQELGGSYQHRDSHD